MSERYRRRIGRVDYWPTHMIHRRDRRTGEVHVSVDQWGPVPGQGKPEAEPEERLL